MSERLLTAADVAELLAVPESWVREHTRNDSLPRIQLGRYIRYRREAITAWLESQETPDATSRSRTRHSRTQTRGPTSAQEAA
jgi:excisionase family DNA binding protein